MKYASALFCGVVLLATACERTDEKEGSLDGLVGTTTGVEDADGDGVTGDEDCDDLDASVGPGAEELCDGVDNNCDGVIDEGVTLTFYADADGDGFGDASVSAEACSAPEGMVPGDTDCDDTNAAVYPDALEVCDALDNDCDGDIDEDIGDIYFTDADGDGFGDPETGAFSCAPGPDQVDDDTDCDDADAANYPGGEEVCDEQDNNCDGRVDEGTLNTYYADTDLDGWGDLGATTEACLEPPGYSDQPGDCDPTDGSIYPGAAEVCDGIDQDCDGVADNGVLITFYADADADGHGDPSTTADACTVPSGYTTSADDCNDADAAVSPSATEVCNSIDDDCDGATDDADMGLDLSTASTWYADTDADGYGDPSASSLSCLATSGTVADSTDCDPSDGTIYPGAAEVCDGIDQDCDGTADNGVLLTFYADADSDGHGDASSTTEACSAPSGYTSSADDCDDASSAVSPSATEVCNSIDDDCDGAIDDDDSSLDLTSASTFYDDSDGDGFGDASATSLSCVATSTTVSDATDCDDTDATVNPGAPEICDGQDNDCDGSGDLMDGSAAACPAADCLDVLDYSTTDGTYWVEPGTSGAYEVYCDQTTEGGGWTLAWVVSDDGTNTWTWNDRLLMSTDTTLVGSLSDRTADFKSMAAHEVLFEDLLFVHNPSGVTAEYDLVGDGTMDLGSHIDSLAAPNCDFSMAGNGHALTGGTLTLGGNMCDTDLYFNLGDHESSLAYCLNLGSSYNHATYGPAWSHGNNNGCPFDDPSSHALGPANECASCGATVDDTESRGMGFASTRGWNTGSAGSATNHMWVYVR